MNLPISSLQDNNSILDDLILWPQRAGIKLLAAFIPLLQHKYKHKIDAIWQIR